MTVGTIDKLLTSLKNEPLKNDMLTFKEMWKQNRDKNVTDSPENFLNAYYDMLRFRKIWKRIYGENDLESPDPVPSVYFDRDWRQMVIEHYIKLYGPDDCLVKKLK